VFVRMCGREREPLLISLLVISHPVCMSVCVCVRERERERERWGKCALSRDRQSKLFPSNHRSLLQNIVCFTGLLCIRDL